MFNTIKNHFKNIEKITGNLYIPNDKKLIKQKKQEITENDLLIGYENEKPIILDYDITRQHTLIVGQNYNVFLNNIIDSLLRNNKGMVFLEDFSTMNIPDIIYKASKENNIDMLRFFSFSNELPFETTPKIPFELILSDDEKFILDFFQKKETVEAFAFTEEELYETYTIDPYKIKISRYKMMLNKWNQELFDKNDFPITEKFLNERNVENYNIMKNLPLNSEHLLYQDNEALSVFHKRLQNIISYINLFNEDQIMYDTKTGCQIWKDLLFNYKCFFDTRHPSAGIVINILQYILSIDLGASFSNIYDNDPDKINDMTNQKYYLGDKKRFSGIDVIYPIGQVLAIKGIGVMSAQARALHVRMFYTMPCIEMNIKDKYLNKNIYNSIIETIEHQDINTRYYSEQETKSIIANTNTKIIMEPNNKYTLLFSNEIIKNISKDNSIYGFNKDFFYSIVKPIQI